MNVLEIPAERYNAIARAVETGRDRLPFSVRQAAVIAAEQVASAWESQHAKWIALYDEVTSLRDENDRLRSAAADPRAPHES